LGLPEDYRTVVRLHRGHAMMRGWLLARVGPSEKKVFPFMGERRGRVVRGGFERLER
jgi:hypothetical protein